MRVLPQSRLAAVLALALCLGSGGAGASEAKHPPAKHPPTKHAPEKQVDPANKQPKLLPGDYALTLLYFADLRGQLYAVSESGGVCAEASATGCQGGLARLANAIQKEKNSSPNSLVFGTGNAMSPVDAASRTDEAVMASLMDRMPLDAAGVGPTEFSAGSPPLGSFIRYARFNLIAANVEVDRDPILRDRVLPIEVLERKGRRLGITGYVPDNMRAVAKPSEQTVFLPAETALRAWIRRMVEVNKTNEIVVLSNAGLERDKQIAASVENIDIILGLRMPGQPALDKPIVVSGPKERKVVIAQVDRFGRSLGRLDVVFDKRGTLKSWTGKQIALDASVGEDAQMAAQLGPRRTSQAEPTGDTTVTR